MCIRTEQVHCCQVQHSSLRVIHTKNSGIVNFLCETNVGMHNRTAYLMNAMKRKKRENIGWNDAYKYKFRQVKIPQTLTKVFFLSDSS